MKQLQGRNRTVLRSVGLLVVLVSGILSVLGSGGESLSFEPVIIDDSDNAGWVTITYPTTADSYAADTSPQYLSGGGFISPTSWRCCSGDASDTGVHVSWVNEVTGQGGSAEQHVSICWFLWSPYLCNHRWSANIPVVEGANPITVTASDPSGNFGTDRITIIRSVDTTPPAVVSTDPEEGATNVAPFTALIARFNESVDPASVTDGCFTLFSSGGQQVVGTLSVSQTGLDLYFDHVELLEDDESYTATVTNAITDLSGNHLTADYSWTFQTGAGDTVPPTVVGALPTDGAVDVSPDDSIVVNFSEPVNESTITPASFLLYDIGDNRVDGTIATTPDSATFTPSTTLQENAQYRAVITTAVIGLDGNPLATEYSWSFTTGLIDLTPPTIVSTSPAAGETDVALDGTIVVTFSESMDETSINDTSFLLEDASGNQITGTISGGILKPYAPLAPNETYTVTLTTAISDVAGNPLSQPYVWSFTTAEDGIGTWTATSMIDAPAPRVAATAVWTGTEMIVWGGFNGNYLNSGGLYNPATDTWQPMSGENAPPGRTAHVAVWTGTEMIVWGGYPYTNIGGRYNPATDTWAPLTTIYMVTRSYASVVWTGTEMIAWGSKYPYVDQGLRYSPGLNSWQTVSTIGAPQERSSHSGVWTGSRMIIWGGEYADEVLNSGGSYDPVTDSWTSISSINAPYSYQHATQWTGSEMLVWGGVTASDNGNAGYRYDPVADSWSVFSTPAALLPRASPVSAWTGQHLIVWGGDGLNSGGIYDPEADSWDMMSFTDAPAGRSGGVCVWTGSEFIVWGGRDTSGALINSGGRFHYP